MVNIILKFGENPKKKGQLISFFKKRVYFLVDSSKNDVKPDEYWECFVWVEKEKYTLVKPFKKIDESLVKEEIERVTEFNDSVRKLDSYIKSNEDFEKMVFDEKNVPYIKTSLRLKQAYEKYENYIVKKIDDVVVVRPIITAADRSEWQKSIQLR